LDRDIVEPGALGAEQIYHPKTAGRTDEAAMVTRYAWLAQHESGERAAADQHQRLPHVPFAPQRSLFEDLCTHGGNRTRFYSLLQRIVNPGRRYELVRRTLRANFERVDLDGSVLRQPTVGERSAATADTGTAAEIHTKPPTTQQLEVGVPLAQTGTVATD